MSDRRKAMVEEILEYVNLYRDQYGQRPSQQEIDDFIYSWRTK